MDFVIGFPKTTKGNESTGVVVDRLNKLADLILIKISYSLQKLAEVYISEIVKLHGIPSSIVLNRDLRFASRFWKSLQETLETKLRLTSAYHPLIDDQIENTIQSLEDLLRACALEQRVIGINTWR